MPRYHYSNSTFQCLTVFRCHVCVCRHKNWLESHIENWVCYITPSIFSISCSLFSLQADFSELLGLTNYMDVMMFVTFLERVVPVSDERVKVAEERFDGVEVVVYEPRHERGTGERRRAIIYLHGGGWCLGSSSESHQHLIDIDALTDLYNLTRWILDSDWSEEALTVGLLDQIQIFYILTIWD